MEINGNNFKQKLSKKFCCKICHYSTDRKSNLENHFNSNKHKKEINGNNFKQELSNLYMCKDCDKVYQTNAGLWKHKNKNNCCKVNEPDIEETPLKTEHSEKDELINYLMNESKELKNLILEVLKNGKSNVNNINNINSHNKSFNLQFFLNETCKDAMNITDFVKKIKLQLSDLENVGEIGYVDGISNIILKNLKVLDITQRPIHCTDKKRETLYIKDENKWEKEDEENNKIRKVIKQVSHKNSALLKEYREKYPDYGKSESKYSDQYNKLIIEAMGGKGNNEFEKEDNIIKKIIKEVIIDK
jgi:hypothetical protein